MPLLLMFVLLIVIVIFVSLLSSIRFIPNNRVGIVEKRFSGKGSVKEGWLMLNTGANGRNLYQYVLNFFWFCT